MQKNKVFISVVIVCSLLSSVYGQPRITNPVVKWKFQSGSPVRGGIASSADALYFGNSEGYLLSLDKMSGTVRWKHKAAGAIVCKPAVTNDVVVFASRDNHVYAVKASSGLLIWKFEMQNEAIHPWGWDYYMASPVIHENVVYVGSGDHHIYSLDLRNGNLLWKFKTGGKVRATPLLHQDKLYAPSFDGTVYILNGADGKLLWKFETEGTYLKSEQFGWDRNAINASPAIQDSLMVFGSRDGSLYCVNIHSRKQKWKFTYGPTWVIASPIIKDGAVLNGWSDNSYFSSIDLLTGKENWKHNCGSFVYPDAVADQNHVYAAAGNGKIFGFLKKDGRLQWEYQTDGAVFSSPLLENGVLYFGSDDGSLYAFTDGVTARRAVYSPDRFKSRFIQVGMRVDDKIAPYFIQKGYEKLDSAGLITFMNERITDNIPSVIVFAHDYLPPNVTGDDPKNNLFRKYMESGGKVMRPGQLPNIFKTDSKHNYAGIDFTYASKVLEVDVDVPFESGNYFARATQEGLNWGLPEKFTATNCYVSETRVTVLAVNEIGRPAAWFKKLGDKPNGGYVAIRSWSWITQIRDSDLELMYRLAEYGL